MPESSNLPLWRRFFEIDDRLRKLGPPPPNFTILKLTVSQLILLKHLYNMYSGTGVTLKDLAKAHGVTPATASEMVDSLVRKNVIVRTDNPADRRSILLRPSDQWLDYFKSYERELSKITDGFFSRLTAEKLQTVLETVAELEEYLNEKEKDSDKW